jgi:hypothetical protein
VINQALILHVMEKAPAAATTEALSRTPDGTGTF